MSSTHEQLAAIARGDTTAFRQFYDDHCVRVYNTALSYLQNAEDAEELTQEVFLKVHRSADQFSGQSSVSTWVYRITVNSCLDVLKRKRRWSALTILGDRPELDRLEFHHPGVLLERKEKAAILFQAIDTLPDNQKTAFILSFVEDLPRQEVADIMQQSLKAIESLLQRAKKNLRLRLEKWTPDRRK